ncbi:MAG: phosphotransferase [Micromonosporaceae bacterium]
MHPPTSDPPTELEGVAAALGLHVEGELRRTDKTLLAAGRWNDRPVVVKLLTDTDPFWVAKWRHEIDVYRIFRDHPPPVRAAKLLHTDGRRLLIVERLPGVPVDRDRYPARPVEAPAVNAAADAVVTLASWRPAPPGFQPIFNYPDRIARYHAHGLLDGTDRQALTTLLEASGDQWEVNHGDPLPSNIIYDGAICGLVDWEFTGLYLPGFDLAMLHTVLANTPHARDVIDHHVTTRNIQVPFAVNLAMAITRELRLHRELPADNPQRRRLATITATWRAARQRIHTLASQAGH